MPMRQVIGLGLLLLGLAACAAAPETPPPLDGTRWTLRSADGGALAPHAGTSGITLRFEGERLSGYGGCNQYGGSFRLEQGNLSVDPVTATKRACVGSGNESEQAWFALLSSPLRLEHEADALRIIAADGSVLHFAPDLSPDD
jgi:heat shock protein HslJ